MGVFKYSAIDAANDLVKGTIPADTARQARELLRLRGLSIQSIESQKENRDGLLNLGKLLRSKSSSRNVTTAARELATLLSAGIPLLEALETIAQQARGSFRTSLLMVQDRVRSGIGLAEAMREQPAVFDELATQMVEVGENAGNLHAVLDQLANFQEKYHNLKDRVFTAMLYPMIVLFFGIAVSIFLMSFVVPMLLDNLLGAGQALPWPTRLLRAISDTIAKYGVWGFGAFCIAISLTFITIQTDKGKLAWHRLLLRLPLFGQMARKQSISRIAMIMSTLLKSGIVFVKSAEIAGDSTKNLVMKRALRDVTDAVGAGRDIGDSLAASDAFPPMVVQIFSVGQRSGTLDVMLDRLASDYDRQVATLSARLVTILEPLLIVFLAVFVGFILFATILPILEAGNVL